MGSPEEISNTQPQDEHTLMPDQVNQPALSEPQPSQTLQPPHTVNTQQPDRETTSPEDPAVKRAKIFRRQYLRTKVRREATLQRSAILNRAAIGFATLPVVQFIEDEHY
jgi:outer membrane biosynthesis protein TonB